MSPNSPTFSPSSSENRSSTTSLHRNQQPLDETISNLTNILKRHKLLIIIPIILAESFAIYSYYVHKTFSATSKLIFQKPDNSSLQSISLDLGASKSQLMNYNWKDNYLETVLLYLNTQDSFEEIAKDLLDSESGQNLFYDLKRNASNSNNFLGRFASRTPARSPQNENQVSAFAALLRGATRFEKGPISGFYVSAETQSAALSVAVARTMAEKTQQLITRRDLKQLGDGKNYISSKLDELLESLNGIEKEMLAIRKKSNGPISNKGLENNLTSFHSIKADLEENKIKLDQNEKLIRSISQQLQNQSRPDQKNYRDIASVAITKRQLAALIARKKSLLSEGMSEQSPQVLSLAEEIKNTSKQLSQYKTFERNLSSEEPLGFLEDNINPELRISELKKENWLLRSRIGAAQKLLLTEKLAKSSLPEDEQKYYALTKRLEMRYLLYGELSKQLFNIDVSRISIQNRVINIETASLASVSRKPTLFPLLPMAFIFALVVGTLLATVVEQYDPTIKSSKDFPVFNYVSLGNIPIIREAKTVASHFKGASTKSLIFRHQLDLPQNVPFKRVRTRIIHLERTLGQRPKIISIHSTHSGDGKSFVCGNVAASLASLNKKVLLMDLDLRKKAITRELAGAEAKGITTYLQDPKLTEYKQFILREIQPCLDVFPSGPATHHSAEVINSSKFITLLKELKEMYDYVLIDNAPFMALPDSEIVASHSDLLVMVASCHKTKVNDLMTMLEHFLQFGEKTVCLVLNRTSGKNQLYYYYGAEEQKTRAKVA